jgi:uncharacterized protein YukE
MSFDGMDVDQAQRLAQRLDGYARALTQITAMLTTLTAELSQHWRGPASATFQQRWVAQYHGALSSAAHALADMHTHLVANIQQQIQTSAADHGGGQTGGSRARAAIAGLTLAGLLSGVGRVWNAVETADGRLSAVETPLEKIMEVAGNKDVTGRYDKAWTRLMELDNNSPLLKYKQSPVLQWLHDNPHVQRANDLLTQAHAPAVLDKLDKIGAGMSVLSAGVSGGEAGADLAQHHYASAGGHLVDLTAGALKSSDNPVAYLAGFDISLYKKDFELAQQIQWNNIPNPFDPGVFRSDYVPTFKALPGELVSTLTEIM